MHTAKKKSFLVAVICLVLCVALLVGTTFAWFTDSVSNTGNKIQAGTLDVGLYRGTANDQSGIDWTDISGDSNPVFNSDKWEPGYSQNALLKVKNEGNLAFKFTVALVPQNGSTMEINAEGHSLANAIIVYSKVGETTVPTAVPADSEIDNTDPTKWQKHTLAEILSDPEGEGLAHGVLLPAGSTPAIEGYEAVGEATMAVILKMDESAGNEYQGLKLGSDIDIQVRATQYTYEKDGFDSNQYDSSANGSPDNTEFDAPTVFPTVQKSAASVDEDNKTTATATIENDGLTTEIPTGVKLTDDTTVTDGKADIKTGFEFVKNEPSTPSIVLEDDQSAVYYNLTLNVDESNSVLVKNTVNIGKERTGVAVYHAGTAMTLAENGSLPSSPAANTEYYYYNVNTGDLVMWVFHASPIDIVYDTVSQFEAEIGEVKYQNFMDALAAAQDGDTITLLSDADISDYDITKSITIDLNKKTLTRIKETDGGYSLKVSKGVNLTIKNGNWDIASDAGYGNITAELKNCTANVTYQDVVFTNRKTPKAGGNSTEGTELVFKGSLGGAGVVNATFTNCKFNNAKVEFSGYNENNNFVGVFSNCEFNNLTNSAAIKADNYGMGTESSITATGCTFNITETSYIEVFETRYNGNNVALNITDNTVNGIAADSSKYVVFGSSLKVYDSGYKFNVTESGTVLKGNATLK